MKPAFPPRSPEVFDYVIVGAGSAGCVLANRLSADPAIRVLLLEAGGEDSNWWIHVPIGMSMLLGNPEVDWCYHSEPEPYADQRVTPVPRGKVLGGSSAINALCYIRGHANDYDQWAAEGNPGWSWREVLPHFKARGTGHVINVSSVLGRIPMATFRSAYCGAKHFLNALTITFRDEVQQTHPGIQFSLVSPPVVRTEFGLNALHGGPDSRTLPNSQSAEEVAAVIADVIESRRPDVYTVAGTSQRVAEYYATIGVDGGR